MERILALRWRQKDNPAAIVFVSVHRDEQAAALFANQYMTSHPDITPDSRDKSKDTIGAYELPIGRRRLLLTERLETCPSISFSIKQNKPSQHLKDFNRLSRQFQRGADVPIIPITLTKPHKGKKVAENTNTI